MGPDAPLLENAQDAAVTSDGRDVLVVTDSGILLSYARNPDTGALTQSQCLQHVDPQGDDAVYPKDSGPPGLDPGCTAAKALSDTAALAVSSDGRAVFTASPDDYLAAFERDRFTGRLSQFGCAEDAQTYKSCSPGRGLDGASALAASPDARNLYLASSNDDVATFASSVAITSTTAVARAAGTASGSPAR